MFRGACFEDREHFLLAAKMSRGDEPRALCVLGLVAQARGETVERGGLVEATFLPQQSGVRVQAIRIARAGAQCAEMPAARVGSLARIGAQLDGKCAPEERLRFFPAREILETRAALGGVREIAQRVVARPAQVVAVGKKCEQRFGGGEGFGLVAVVPRDVAASGERHAVRGCLRFERGERRGGGRAIVPVECAVQRKAEIVERRFGEFDAVEPVRFRLWQEDHRARAGECVVGDPFVADGFGVMLLVRVADEDGAADAVVADDGLEVRGGSLDRREREGNAAIQQRDRRLPRRAEFADDETIFLRPIPLLVAGRAVVANAARECEVVHGRLPESADRAERGGCASHLVLAHKRDGEGDHARICRRCREPRCDLFVESVFCEPRVLGGLREIAELIMRVGHSRVPVLERRTLDGRREIAVAPPRCERLGVVLVLGQQRGELREDGRAFQPRRRVAEQCERVIVATEQREMMRDALHRGPVPRL